MPRFKKKKPAEFGAVQWTGRNWNEVRRFVKSPFIVELCGSKDMKEDAVFLSGGQEDMVAYVGDWIVCNEDGAFWTHRGEYFYEFYSPMVEEKP